MRWCRALAVALGALSSGSALTAQSTELVDLGIRAYNDVDPDAAAGFLRRWFASDDAARAAIEDRRRALTYLGAAELLRNQRDSGTAAFERLVKLDPRYRIDELLFPPEVTTLFAAARQRTKAVSLHAPAVPSMGADGGEFTARLFASSTHLVQVQVRRPDGLSVRVLYDGPIGDSLDVRWDGRDSTGSMVPSASYYLEVRSGAFRNVATRVLQLPMDVTAQITDTLPHPLPPADSLRLMERRPAAPGTEALAGGLVAGIAVTVLPMLLAPGADTEAARFVIAALVGGVGVWGFSRQFPGAVIAANRVTNEEIRRTWEEQAAAVTAENRTRRSAARLVIRTGEPIVTDLAGR